MANCLTTFEPDRKFQVDYSIPSRTVENPIEKMSSQTPYRYFDFHQVFSRTKAFIDQYNEKHPKLTEKLNANHRATAELMIRLYLKQLNKLSQCFPSEENELPGFKTYNASLAKCKGCTTRTIINHKERLKKAGFIISEEHRGAQGIELFLSLEIVLNHSKTVTDSGEEILKIEPETHFKEEKTKNFHPLVHEPHEQRNNNSTVENSKGVRQEAHENGLFQNKPTRTVHEPDKNTGEIANSTSNACEKSTEVDRISLLSFVRQFWEFTRKVLYPQLILSDPEERDIMNMIWASVYFKFNGDLSVKKWSEYHEQAIDRIIMVKKWLDRSPHHWIPKPHLYFSPHNEKNGFQVTLQWLLKREILKMEVQQQLEMQRVRYEQNQHENGRGRYKHLSRLQLFRIHEERLRKFKNPEALNTYYLTLKRITVNKNSP